MPVPDTMIALINFFSALIFALLVGFCITIFIRSRKLRYPVFFLGFSFTLICAVSVFNIFEHLNIAKAMDKYEEYAEVLFLPFILLFCYSWTSSFMVEKNRKYAQELQHRVKNNLQIIESLLMVQRSTLPEGDAAEVIDASRRRILSIGLAEQFLHESSGPLSDTSCVDMSNYLNALLLQDELTFFDEGQRPGFAISCEKIVFNAETAISCGLIVNELVLLLRSVPKEKQELITLTLKKTEKNRYELSFSMKGTLPKNDFSGKLVEILCAQLKNPVHKKTGGSFTLEFSPERREELRWQLRG